MATSTGTVLEWERIAMNGGEMPEGLPFADQVLFMALRMLYHQHREGLIDRDTAVSEKKKLLDSYRIWKFREDQGDRWVQTIKQTELARAAYRKERTIENADKLLFAIDGVK